MTQKTFRKTRQPSAAADAPAGAQLPSTIPQILDNLANTESLLATAIAAVGTEDVDTEDVQITLVIVRARIRATMKRVRALQD